MEPQLVAKGGIELMNISDIQTNATLTLASCGAGRGCPAKPISNALFLIQLCNAFGLSQINPNPPPDLSRPPPALA